MRLFFYSICFISLDDFTRIELIYSLFSKKYITDEYSFVKIDLKFETNPIMIALTLFITELFFSDNKET